MNRTRHQTASYSSSSVLAGYAWRYVSFLIRMLVFQITFDLAEGEVGEEQLDEVQWLLETFRMDGHILGREFQITSTLNQINAFVLAADEDSFEQSTFNEYIQTRLRKIDGINLSGPKCIKLGDKLTSALVCKCRDTRAYILFTTCPWSHRYAALLASARSPCTAYLGWRPEISTT